MRDFLDDETVSEMLGEIVDAIDRERDRQNLTMSELSDRANMSCSTYSKARKTRVMAIETILRCIEALDMEICLVNMEGENVL